VSQLTLAIIEGLKAKGMSQAEIGRQFGVTRQAVSWHVRTYGGTLTPRQKALESWPFIVPVELCQQSAYKRLRDHGEYMATNGEGMNFDKLSRLRGFYDRLKEFVLEFDPVEGFVYRERLESDADLLIRVNEHTFVSDEGLNMWRMPASMPEFRFDSEGLISKA